MPFGISVQRTPILKLTYWKIYKKLKVIPHNLYYEGLFFQKDWHVIGIFVIFFNNVAAYGKRPVVPHLLAGTVRVRYGI